MHQHNFQFLSDDAEEYPASVSYYGINVAYNASVGSRRAFLLTGNIDVVFDTTSVHINHGTVCAILMLCLKAGKTISIHDSTAVLIVASAINTEQMRTAISWFKRMCYPVFDEAPMNKSLVAQLERAVQFRIGTQM